MKCFINILFLDMEILVTLLSIEIKYKLVHFSSSPKCQVLSWRPINKTGDKRQGILVSVKGNACALAFVNEYKNKCADVRSGSIYSARELINLPRASIQATLGACKRADAVCSLLFCHRATRKDYCYYYDDDERVRVRSIVCSALIKPSHLHIFMCIAERAHTWCECAF